MTETMIYQLPVHWAPALINDDWTGINEEDEEQLMNFLFNELAGENIALTLPDNEAEEPFFMKHHDAHLYGCKACDCYNYVAINLD